MTTTPQHTLRPWTWKWTIEDFRLIAAAPDLLTQAIATADMLEEQAGAMRLGAVREALQGRAVCLRDAIRRATDGAA